ncbi:MAG: hypothetical protein ACLQVJ_30050 [Syntrophobacteraceae bacterium]
MSKASKSSSSSKSSKSSIHIKPENRGKFTKDAKEHGESVQERAKEVLKPGSKASATEKKRANFARNAAKWKKGGK